MGVTVKYAKGAFAMKWTSIWLNRGRKLTTTDDHDRDAAEKCFVKCGYWWRKAIKATINFLSISIILILGTLSAQAYTWIQWSYSETSPIDGSVRDVRITYPSDFTVIRGLLINFNASSGDTRDEYSRKYFMNWLRLPEHQFAFVGTRGFEHSPQSQYSTPVLNNALISFAQQSGHFEITNAPWAMYAFSAGASRSQEVTSTNAQKVIAWNAISGGFGFPLTGPVQLLTTNEYQIPAYVNASKSDAGTITNSNYQVTSTNVPLGWLASFSLIQQGTSHNETWNQHAPGMAFLKSVIKFSYPTGQCVLYDSPMILNRMVKSDGWLVTPSFQGAYMPDVTNYSAYPGNKTNAWFLPDKDFAYVYRSYASWDNKLAITSPLTEIEVAPNQNLPITIDDSQFLGWTNLALFNFSTNLMNKTSGTASFVITNIQPGMYVLHVIGTKSGTNAISQPVLFYANLNSVPAVQPCPAPSTWYVATNGLPSNSGAIGSPWDLQSAIATNLVHPRDYIQLRTGTYTHAPQGVVTGNEGYIFKATVSGLPGLVITVRSMTNEWATIDGGAFGAGINAFHANARPTMLAGDSNDETLGRYVRFRNLEICSTSTEARFSGDDSAFPASITRSDGFYAYGIGVELINCVMHDTTAGISSFPGGQGDEGYNQVYYGNVIYNCGWTGTPNMHGHGFYMQQYPGLGLKWLINNFVNGNYYKGMQIYGSGSAKIWDFRVFGNCLIGKQGIHGAMLVGTRTGTADRMGNDWVYDNFGYGADFQIYEQPDADSYVDLRMTGNYFVNAFLQLSSWKQAVITNNAFISPTLDKVISLWTNDIVIPWTNDYNRYNISNANYAAFRIEGHGPTAFNQWTNDTAYDIHSTLAVGYPTGTNLVVLQPNAYDRQRAQVIAYNWTGANTIAVNVASLGWAQNDTVLVHNIQDFFRDAPGQAVSVAGTITLNMQAGAHTVAVPFGDTLPTNDKSFPNFGAFVLENIGGGSAPPPINTTSLNVTSSNPSSGIFVSMSPADIDGLSNGTTGFGRTVVSNSVTTLTAPLTAGSGNVFSLWQRNGATYTTTLAATFTNSIDLTLNAVYAAPSVPLGKSGASAASGVRRGLRF